MKNSWRIIISGKMSPAENMGMDKTILEGVIRNLSPQTIRIYDWSQPTISFGFHQDIKSQINLEKVRGNGFGIVRRPTGGRAVLHWDEVTYSVIGKVEGIFEGSILKVYKKIGTVLLHSLHKVGIEADMEDTMSTNSDQKNWTNPCFSSASKYEIHYKGKKIIGSAQTRKAGYFLQHGSILLNNNQEKMAELLPTNKESEREVLRKLLAKKTISINQILNNPLEFTDFAQVLKENFQEEFDIQSLESHELNKDEIKVYQRILEEINKENRTILLKNKK